MCAVLQRKEESKKGPPFPSQKTVYRWIKEQIKVSLEKQGRSHGRPGASDFDDRTIKDRIAGKPNQRTAARAEAMEDIRDGFSLAVLIRNMLFPKAEHRNYTLHPSLIVGDIDSTGIEIGAKGVARICYNKEFVDERQQEILYGKPTEEGRRFFVHFFTIQFADGCGCHSRHFRQADPGGSVHGKDNEVLHQTILDKIILPEFEKRRKSLQGNRFDSKDPRSNLDERCFLMGDGEIEQTKVWSDKKNVAKFKAAYTHAMKLPTGLSLLCFRKALTLCAWRPILARFWLAFFHNWILTITLRFLYLLVSGLSRNASASIILNNPSVHSPFPALLSTHSSILYHTPFHQGKKFGRFFAPLPNVAPQWFSLKVTRYSYRVLDFFSIHERVIAEMQAFALTTAFLLSVQTALSQCPVPRVRHSWKHLDKQERQTFVDAVSALKRNGEYNVFEDVHVTNMAFSHGSHEFLLWHRHFLWVFEERLRAATGTCVTVPYWPWEEDRSSEQANAISGNLGLSFGQGTGCIETGLAAGWRTINNRCSTLVSLITGRSSFADFRVNYEAEPHTNPHMMYGGTMATSSSPADPVFWLHHSNVDRHFAIWQDFHGYSGMTHDDRTRSRNTLAFSNVNGWTSQFPYGGQTQRAGQLFARRVTTRDLYETLSFPGGGYVYGRDNLANIIHSSVSRQIAWRQVAPGVVTEKSVCGDGLVRGQPSERCDGSANCPADCGVQDPFCSLIPPGTSHPCNAHGTCSNGACRCNGEWRGQRCQTDGFCERAVCQSGARCQNGICVCLAGFTGEFCQVDVFCVAANPPCTSASRGVCLTGACKCTQGFAGPRCETNVFCNAANACNGRGTCSEAKCTCRPGFSGQRCENGVCVVNPCQNGGTCSISAQGLPLCACVNNWNGSTCQVDLCSAQLTPCVHGQCSRGTCTCQRGFQGKSCNDTVLDRTCTPDPCRGRSLSCVRGVCQCQVGWTGWDCEIDELCLAKDCHGRGSCFQGQCNCSTGFSGQRCEVDVFCAAHGSCSGHGVCSNGGCTCQPGFSGQRCGTGVCDANPCKNGGTCTISAQGLPLCACVGDWGGPNCETDLCSPGLLPSPCIHGLCSKGRCLCKQGFTGLVCNDTIFDRACTPDPCHGRSTSCLRGVCECQTGWSGWDCEVDGLCLAEDCNGHGSCFQGDCNCSTGFSGQHCEMDLFCAAYGNCSGHGKCSNGRCDCDLGWAGPVCARDLFCSRAPSPCMYNGRCVDGKCQCAAGWAGEICETRLSDPFCDLKPYFEKFEGRSCQRFADGDNVLKTLGEAKLACPLNRECVAIVCRSGNENLCTLRAQANLIPWASEDCYVLRQPSQATVAPAPQWTVYRGRSCQGYANGDFTTRTLAASRDACAANSDCQAIMCPRNSTQGCTLRRQANLIEYSLEDCYILEQPGHPCNNRGQCINTPGQANLQQAAEIHLPGTLSTRPSLQVLNQDGHQPAARLSNPNISPSSSTSSSSSLQQYLNGDDGVLRLKLTAVQVVN
eukprot:g78951.t1